MDIEHSGNRIMTSFSGNSSGSIISPFPETFPDRPFKKNGMSDPKDLPRSNKTSKDKLSFARLLTASIAVAALELPPPSPEPRGMFFSIFIE